MPKFTLDGFFLIQKKRPVRPDYLFECFTGVSGITSKKSRKAYQNDGLAFCLL